MSRKIQEKLLKYKPIFIIGLPRCGSTLIEKVIASGSKVIPMGEEAGINKKILEKQSLNLGDCQ